MNEQKETNLLMGLTRVFVSCACILTNALGELHHTLEVIVSTPWAWWFAFGLEITRLTYCVLARCLALARYDHIITVRKKYKISLVLLV